MYKEELNNAKLLVDLAIACTNKATSMASGLNQQLVFSRFGTSCVAPRSNNIKDIKSLYHNGFYRVILDERAYEGFMRYIVNVGWTFDDNHGVRVTKPSNEWAETQVYLLDKCQPADMPIGPIEHGLRYIHATGAKGVLEYNKEWFLNLDNGEIMKIINPSTLSQITVN